MKSRSDFLGHQVCIDNDVVFVKKEYGSLKHGKVIMLGDKYATVQLENQQGALKTACVFYEDLLRTNKDIT